MSHRHAFHRTALEVWVVSYRLAVIAVACLATCVDATVAFAQTVKPAAMTLADQPLSFEENRGQADPRVKYVSRARDYTVALTADEALLMVRKARPSTSTSRLQAQDVAVMRMRLIGALPAPRTS